MVGRDFPACENLLRLRLPRQPVIGMQIGYMRVSKGDDSQTTAPQRSALKAAGASASSRTR